MPKHLITSDASIKRIKPADGIRRLSDGDGLYLLLAVKGGSHCWRFDYTIDTVRKTFSFGTYPATTLSHARRLAEDARRMVREGIDPSLARKTARADRLLERQRQKLVAVPQRATITLKIVRHPAMIFVRLCRSASRAMGSPSSE